MQLLIFSLHYDSEFREHFQEILPFEFDLPCLDHRTSETIEFLESPRNMDITPYILAGLVQTMLDMRDIQFRPLRRAGARSAMPVDRIKPRKIHDTKRRTISVRGSSIVAKQSTAGCVRCEKRVSRENPGDCNGQLRIWNELFAEDPSNSESDNFEHVFWLRFSQARAISNGTVAKIRDLSPHVHIIPRFFPCCTSER
jgi:hypothetical protein